ncbi:MAG TPA: hypothetical protein VKX46_14180 [Ktedonobacteraceae bacterium]|nr:hypothetical protein [Ktedonobacteraceae bacterium]
MNKQPSVAKTLVWVYGTVIAFAGTYLIGGILLERRSQKKQGARP